MGERERENENSQSSRVVSSLSRAVCECIARNNLSLLEVEPPGTVNDDESDGKEKETRIPHIAHFVWLGDKPMPAHAARCIELFRCVHPHWAVRCWTQREVHEDSELRELLRDVCNEGMQSDLLRYAVLFREGGVYLDVDYEALRSLECIPGLVDGRTRFFAGFSHTACVEINNGVLGCTSKHPLMGEILRTSVGNHRRAYSKHAPILSFLPPSERRAALIAMQVESPSAILTLTGPMMLNRLMNERILSSSSSGADEFVSLGVLLLPYDVFHPIPNRAMVKDLCERLPSISSELSAANERTVDTGETTVAITQRIADSEAYFHDGSVVSPFASWGDYDTLKREFVTKCTVAIHWWQRSWQ